VVGFLRGIQVFRSGSLRREGAALLAHAERTARRRGIAALYLLTTTAEAFLSRRGYVRLPREAAPSVLRQTTEFAALCPASAVCLTRTLTAAAAAAAAAADRTTRN